MKKRTAWICCISVTLVVGGYVAWCGRRFYLPARFDNFHELPPEVAAMLPPLLESRGMTAPARFRADDLLYFLSHPYRSPGAVAIHHQPVGPEMFVFYRDTYPDDWVSNFIIALEDGKWKLQDE